MLLVCVRRKSGRTSGKVVVNEEVTLCLYICAEKKGEVLLRILLLAKRSCIRLQKAMIADGPAEMRSCSRYRISKSTGCNICQSSKIQLVQNTGVQSLVSNCVY